MTTHTQKILIDGNQEEEIRVALVNDQVLYGLELESAGSEKNKASVYMGEITRVEPSLDAVFVKYGANKHGFLPVKEIAPEYLSGSLYTDSGKSNIRDIIKEGQQIIVQIEKDERGTKGAALSTFISLAGCYLVLMPNSSRSGGISRRIEGEERDAMRDIINALEVPDNMSIIIRTAGVGRDLEELRWDLSALLQLWKAIKHVSTERRAPFLIHREGDVIIRAIRDHLRPDTGEIIVQGANAFKKAKEHIAHVRPDFVEKVKQYTGSRSLFDQFNIENQIETAYQREVFLNSGACIVIDSTEALTAIDVNSSKSTAGADIEETALQTNLAAAKEIARQLRLRDLGGLIVIDFIDMSQHKNQRLVENCLKDSLNSDRARIQLGKISRFGLMEMSRQRLNTSLEESNQVSCPRCKGQGRIRSTQSLTLSILRVIQENASKKGTDQLQIQVPVEVASFLMNEKRNAIFRIEKQCRTNIIIIPNSSLLAPNFLLKRIKFTERNYNGSEEDFKEPVSFELATVVDDTNSLPYTYSKTENSMDNEPAISFKSAAPAPLNSNSKHTISPNTNKDIVKTKEGSLIKRIFTSIFKNGEESGAEVQSSSNPANNRNNGNSNNYRNNNNRRSRYNRNNNNRNRTNSSSSSSSNPNSTPNHHANANNPNHHSNPNHNPNYRGQNHASGHRQERSHNHNNQSRPNQNNHNSHNHDNDHDN